MKRKQNKKMNFASIVVFTDPRQTEVMTLKRGHRFMVFSHRESPKAVPIEESGSYEVGADILKDGSFPIAVMMIKSEHVVMWENATAQMIENLFAGIARATNKPNLAIPTDPPSRELQ